MFSILFLLYMSKSDILFLYSSPKKINALNRIKEVLESKGVTQQELGKLVGRSFESINAYCSNRRQPSLELLYEISTALKCSVMDLLIDNIDNKQNEWQ